MTNKSIDENVTGAAEPVTSMQQQPKKTVAGTYRSALTGRRFSVDGEPPEKLKIKEVADES